MKDLNKQLRPWLESWGAWRRLRLNIGYPKQSISCNPDLHIVKPIIEPPFRIPKINYYRALSSGDNADHHLHCLRLAERALREFHHIKRTETKPKRKPIVPNYNPHWRMNIIDRQIYELPIRLREVISLRYESELKTHEIARMIGRTIDTVNKRLAHAHAKLNQIPILMRKNAPLCDQKLQYSNQNCNNAC